MRGVGFEHAGVKSRPSLFSEPLKEASTPPPSVEVRDVGPDTSLRAKDVGPIAVHDHPKPPLALAGKLS